MNRKKNKPRSEATKKTASTSAATFSSNEGDIIDYDSLPIKGTGVVLPEKKSEYYYQDYSYVKPTMEGFEHKQVKGVPLFEKTRLSTSDESFPQVVKMDTSILTSGFGMKNVDSFQRLIKMSQEERKKWELKKLWRDKLAEQRRSRQELEHLDNLTPRTDATASTTIETKSSSDLLTQTETTTEKRTICDQIDYLMGLHTEVEEQPGSVTIPEMEVEEFEEDFKYSDNKAVREAQRYLRVHRIFECFQFLVAHLLSAKAENPVEFILNLLNRCLLYRSGLGEPPLLYERKHIEKLFGLMDRMQTGFIDMKQYATGMQTLGICTYNDFPERTDDGLISKLVFVEEAYEAEVAIFNDLIKKRPEKNKQMYKRTPHRYENVSMLSVNPPYFIPSDLFWKNKSDDYGSDKAQQGE